MTWVESLRKTIDYIEDQLPAAVSVDEAAKAAHFSSAHLQKGFAVLTGMSIGEYIRRRRLTLAAEELTKGSAKVIEVAMKYGYETPESFSKAFRKQHGISPKEARNPGARLACYNPLKIHVTLKGEKAMKYRIEERESFTAVGIHKEFSVVNNSHSNEIPKLWGEVNENGTSDQLFRLNNGKIDGVLGICLDKGNEKIDYWVATEYNGATPEEYEEITIPASKWAVFEVHGPMPDAMQNAWEQIFSEWFPSSAYEHAGTADFEKYTQDDPFSKDLYSEVWIPVK
ncbi:AraC family transcriptional regulator [Salipaludibacillus keqinensis]|uniref:AraC family transcriptional regulator n=1 Tax=Salipaludibacillus keqinensis TaxID=2045207 RepID=A0A323TMA4_9BACI|nr:AraC family transcriptional regulator [Salipaludibacillus keqinensis]PYZ94787.1 AraC family transcriptional regulator [Salipaludibacillus keqinensis]